MVVPRNHLAITHLGSLRAFSAPKEPLGTRRNPLTANDLGFLIRRTSLYLLYRDLRVYLLSSVFPKSMGVDFGSNPDPIRNSRRFVVVPTGVFLWFHPAISCPN